VLDVKEIKEAGAMNNTGSTNTNDISEINNSFYDKYNPQIRAIVTRILRYADKTQDIDDCVNIVYVELMEKLQQYNETRGSMAAFVAIISRSTALDYCRSSMRKTGELIGDAQIDFLSEPIEFENKVEFEMLVENILKELNKKERALFTMRYILFYSPEEIAKALKIRRSAVDMRVSRLRSKIKNFLTKGGITI
jgi:RNA polymerase sigma-70 factor (ECF subfamily)